MSDSDPASDDQPRLYTDLAGWYHLLTAPEEYAEESAFFLRHFTTALGHRPSSLLELGCGGGNMATHYQRHVPSVTLTDLSPHMLAVSQTVNPDLEHILGDMRTLRLGRHYDAVLAHDAVCYLTTEADLRQAMATAFLHLRPGGVAIFAPDLVREKFVESTESDGHASGTRALQYLEWTWDPDPADTTYVADFTYLLREEGQPMRCVYDRHLCGLFSGAEWQRWLRDAGFQPTTYPLEHSEVPPDAVDVFVAVKPSA